MEDDYKNKAAIVEDLKRALAEMEELRAQFALEKAEAKSKYSEIRDRFLGKLLDWKLHFHSLKSNEKILPLVYAFEFLQLKLAWGAAGTKEIFDAQQKRIASALEQVEFSLRISETWDTFYNDLHSEIEKLKMKLRPRLHSAQLTKEKSDHRLKLFQRYEIKNKHNE